MTDSTADPTGNDEDLTDLDVHVPDLCAALADSLRACRLAREQRALDGGR